MQRDMREPIICNSSSRNSLLTRSSGYSKVANNEQLYEIEDRDGYAPMARIEVCLVSKRKTHNKKIPGKLLHMIDKKSAEVGKPHER